MKEAVRTYIGKHHLLVPQEKVLVALSGGPDSVALLLVLHELQYPLIALHCNFHLRGSESDEDQQFVETLCSQHGIPLRITHFQTRTYAQEHHVSIEMAARDLRYQWFSSMRQETGAQAVAVGHHSDDQAETLLLNLVRGTGLRGLAGMHPRQGHIVRPLLCVGRQDILSYLQQKQQDYRTDHTNLEREAQRNCIRMDVIPLLKSLNPKAVENISKAADNLRQSLPFYQQGIEGEKRKQGIGEDLFPLAALQDESLSGTLLHEWLRDKGFSASQQAEILSHRQGESGLTWESDTYRLLLDRGQLLLRRKDELPAGEPVLEYTEVAQMGEHTPENIYVDADTVRLPLLLRKPRQGDRFFPFGMKGSRLLSDFFTDQKMSLFQREAQWVACSGEDIVWIVGKRADNRFRVTGKTKRIVKINLTNP